MWPNLAKSSVATSQIWKKKKKKRAGSGCGDFTCPVQFFGGFIQRRRSVEISCLDSFKTFYVSLCVGNQQFTNVEIF